MTTSSLKIGWKSPGTERLNLNPSLVPLLLMFLIENELMITLILRKRVLGKVEGMLGIATEKSPTLLGKIGELKQ